MSHFTRNKKDVPPGHFGRAQPRGDHLLQMGCWFLMDRTSPERVGRCLECVARC
jgi:hypothetical protein